MEYIYREVEISDAENMIKFLKKVGDETENLSFSGDSLKLSSESEQKFISRFKNNKKDIMLVAESGGEIIANASLESNKITRYSHRAELSIAVLSKYWRRGIGSRLMELLIEFAKISGTEIIYLEARADNERALALYRKFGFECIGIYRKFFKINDKYYESVLMMLEI